MLDLYDEAVTPLHYIPYSIVTHPITSQTPSFAKHTILIHMHFIGCNTKSASTGVSWAQCVSICVTISDAPIRDFADYPIIRYFNSNIGRYR